MIQITRHCTLLAVALAFASPISAQQLPEGKSIYIPKDLRSNDFNDPDAQWSYSRMACTENIVLFWEKGFGDDLSKAPDLDGHPMTVNKENLLQRIEDFYAYYRDSLRFVLPGSKSEKYRMMVMLNYSLEGTAYGGDYDEEIGALWIAPNRVQDSKLNCIAHELGHSFQSQVSSDGKGEAWGGGGIFEMTSQWMLFNVNPEWPTDENYHWKAFIDHANLRFLDVENIYHSPYILEQWSQKRGLGVMADLFREGKRGEDPASTYMRMFNLTNEDFAREAVDCYSRLITFDFKGKHEQNKQYAGEFVNDKPLQTFGANVLKLSNNGKKKISVKFRATGDTANDGFAYRLVKVDKDANATYGKICTAQTATLTMSGIAEGEDVYFVATAFPKGQYKPYTFNPYDRNSQKEEPHVYQYEIKQK